MAKRCHPTLILCMHLRNGRQLTLKTAPVSGTRRVACYCLLYCYIVKLLYCYIVTFLYCYIVILSYCFIVILLYCYIYCYIVFVSQPGCYLACHIVTGPHSHCRRLLCTDLTTTCAFTSLAGKLVRARNVVVANII